VDWGAELRDFRGRTGLKQEALAAHLGISQAFVSRLENGQTAPETGLAARIRALVTDPAGRSVFDYVLDIVRCSPHVQCVIEPQHDGIAYVALSVGFRHHSKFNLIREGMPVQAEASPEGQSLIRHILESGAFSGEVESLDVLWRVDRQDQATFWRAIITPIRAGNDVWYLHCSMFELSKPDFYQRLEERVTPVIVTAYH
jgi:transcriptional regulator with XRE-family HTH domain